MTLGPCDTVDTYPHTMVTREYQASNIREGWAHFYWANAFNDGAEYAEDDECFVEHYNPPFDWDADGAFESGSGEYDALLSCAGSNNVEDAGNYYWDFCDGDSDPFDSVDENVNTGTEIDWLRFLWDLAWDEAPNPHGADRVLALIMGADPSGWNITGHASGAGNPYEEMEDVATSDTGWLFAWVPLQDANGVGQ